MSQLKVSEVFYSLQGEGARAGCPSVFVRLSGCDLACGFCDTEFASGEEMDCGTLELTIERVVLDTLRTREREHSHGPHWIIWTGGEPCLQLTDAHVGYFKERGWQQAIETNGNHKPPSGLDWVACSPKVAEHVLAKNFPDGIDELRYVRHSGQPGIPKPAVKAKRLFLSPMFDGNRPNPANLRHCVNLCLQHPEWSLSVQSHKLLGVL